MTGFDDPFLREKNARGTKLEAEKKEIGIFICGVGALGSNLADNLARQGFQGLTFIDHDRVERHNLSTSAYGLDDVGSKKADALARRLGKDTQVWPVAMDLFIDDETNNIHKALRHADLVIDCLDNSEARKAVFWYCLKNHIPCLHLGMSADGLYGECVWNEFYALPANVPGNPCDVAAARNLILLTTTIASELIVKFLSDDIRNAYITLNDLDVGIIPAIYYELSKGETK